jgi:ComF family protein
MLLLEHLIRLYAPLCCLGCGIESDALVCESCRAVTPLVPSRCYRCRSVTREFAVCERCRKHTALRQVLVATHYEGVAKELLHAVKYERGRSGIVEMVELMAPLLRLLPQDAVFVPVPTATSRVRQRGYDQAVLLAQAISRERGFGVADVLVRLGQAHQVGSNRRDRLLHLKGAFRVQRAASIRGAHVVLVDDVLTTGATIETAARVLKKAGAKQVDAIVFSQAG